MLPKWDNRIFDILFSNINNSRDKFIISEDGYGRIVGRLKDIIIKGGENIAPKEIEDLLNTHPDIVDSQVNNKSNNYIFYLV